MNNLDAMLTRFFELKRIAEVELPNLKTAIKNEILNNHNGIYSNSFCEITKIKSHIYEQSVSSKLLKEAIKSMILTPGQEQVLLSLINSKRKAENIHIKNLR